MATSIGANERQRSHLIEQVRYDLTYIVIKLPQMSRLYQPDLFVQDFEFFRENCFLFRVKVILKIRMSVKFKVGCYVKDTANKE